MALASWAAAAVAAAGLIASVSIAPIAFADPPPEAGTESPGDTINTLKAQGYEVQINWVAGQPSNIPLSQCTVTRIDTSAPPAAWVSVNCPADGSQ